MTGLLLDTDLTPEQRRCAETIRHSGEALLGVINDILDFSKVEAGKLELETLDFDLPDLLDDFAATLAAPAHDKDLELICHADPDVPALVRGDPGRLRQILHNLAGNAVKFTDAGEVVVRASMVERSAATVVLRFSIRDTGIGIPQNQIDRLFDKFSQVDASTTRKFGGTGLGLAIAKQLVVLMGGAIGVESRQGQGSEFWFTARFARSAAARPASATPGDLRGLRVLVVDDNATHRDLLERQLAAWGARADAADDGAAALQVLGAAQAAGDPFDLAIVDLRMPGLDGAALGCRIRTDERFRTLPLVLLVALGRLGDARRCAALGFSAYLSKPIRQAELFDALVQARAAAGDPAATAPLVTRHSDRDTQRPSAMLPRLAGRILLAEDNPVNQQVASGILGKMGLTVRVATTGVEALQTLDVHPCDLVLMDVMMPEMDGLEATRRIRAGEAATGRRIPIIAMTAGAMEQDRERCLEAGMDDYVSKPVNLAELGKTLEKWLPAR
jgi:CheY-like chemotaxis protein